MMTGMGDEAHPNSYYSGGGGGRSGVCSASSSMDDGDCEDPKTNGYSMNNSMSGSNSGLSSFSEEKISQALRVFLTDDR